MESAGLDSVLTADDVQAALAAHGFGTERSRNGAVVLALSDPLRVVWANRSAAALFGTTDPDEMFAQVFVGRGRDGLGGAVERLTPGGGARTERLRLFKGFRTRTLTVSVSRNPAGNGEDIVVLAIPATDIEGGDDEAFALSALHVPPPVAAAADALGPAPKVHAASAEPTEPPPVVPDTPAPPVVTRFVWRTDAAHGLMEMTGAPAELAGLVTSDLLGRPLSEIVAEAGAGPREPLDEALRAARPWRGVVLQWPLADGGAPVPVTLGAVSVRVDGAFVGFRGFGTVDLSHLPSRRKPPMPAPIAAPDAVEAPAAVDRAEDPWDIEPPFVADTVAAPPPADILPPGPSSVPQLGYSSPKVVALRPFQLLNGGGTPVPTQLQDVPPPSRRRDDQPTEAEAEVSALDQANLSSTEHSNFHEIGRTLKGELVERGQPSLAGEPADGVAAILAALPVAIVLAAGNRIVFANAAFFELSGYTSLAALAQVGGLAHLLGGLDAAEVADADTDRAFPVAGAGDTVRLVEGRAAALPWGGAMVQGLILRHAGEGVAQFESLHMELRRRATEAADTRALLDRVSDAVATLDGQGRLLMLSKAGEALFGLHENGVVGESIGALLSQEAQSAALGAVLAANAAGPDAEPGSVSVSGRRPHLQSLMMAPRALRAGRIGVVFRDESGQEGLRREIRHLRAELDHGTGVRADFLGRISHEIRTPLNVILGFAEIMLDERFGPLGNARYKDYLTDIHAAGQQVIDFVDDMFDLSKMQAGRTEMRAVAVDVNRVVGETVAEMQAQAHRDRVIMRLSLMQHLPLALVDEAALRQIMSNILANAIGFNEPGGQVIVSTAPSETGGIAVRVRDTGVGMTDTEVATVLEPIRQVSLGKPGSGKGLGLPLTQALVEANQATMSIKSRKKEGTLVEIGLRPAPGDARSNPAA